MPTDASSQTILESPEPPPSTCSLCGKETSARRRRRSINGFGVCRKCWSGFVNRREAAFLIDWLCWWFVLPAITAAGAWLLPANALQPPVSDTLTSIIAVLVMLSFSIKDGFSGYSPGKYLMGIRVVDMATRNPASFWQSFKRNIHLSIPNLSIIAILVIGLGSWQGRRWGDRWAETVVIWCKHARKPPFNPIGTVCIPCGYDLTGNVSGICPECGTPVPEATRRLVADHPSHPDSPGAVEATTHLQKTSALVSTDDRQ